MASLMSKKASLERARLPRALGKKTRTRREAPNEPCYEAMGRRGKVRALLCHGALCVGCMSSKQPEGAQTYSESKPSITTAQAPDVETEPAREPEKSQGYREAPCHESTCLFFSSNAEATNYLTSHYRPQVLGFGEAHAQIGATSRSTALRFSDSILPAFQGNAPFLLVELMAPPTGCVADKEHVQKETAPILETQAPTNQADYFEIGHRARQLGIPPDLLRPTCEDLRAIGSGDEAIVKTMETIARLSSAELAKHLPKGDQPAWALSRPQFVVAYGGALHNDATPSAPYAAWSYGPQILKDTEGRYLEVDLLLPEGLTESPWARFDWFPQVIAAFDEKRPSEAALIVRGPKSVALILAEEDPQISDDATEDVEN
jgi:hypothetical protein